MTGACLCFAGMNVIIRQLAFDMHPFQVVFFRNLAGLAFMLPWLCRAGATGLRTDHQRYYLGRSFIGFLSMLFWFALHRSGIRRSRRLDSLRARYTHLP